MKLSDVLDNLCAPKGLTSIISGVMSDDFSVLPKKQDTTGGLQMAKDKVVAYQKQLDECKSDWSYWSILSDLEYWKCMVNVLEAADITGPDNLPDVPFPNLEGKVVMDAIYENTKFGAAIFAKAKQTIHIP